MHVWLAFQTITVSSTSTPLPSCIILLTFRFGTGGEIPIAYIVLTAKATERIKVDPTGKTSEETKMSIIKVRHYLISLFYSSFLQYFLLSFFQIQVWSSLSGADDDMFDTEQKSDRGTG